nr:hypothetical protein [Tanacetum cinerariifolium]
MAYQQHVADVHPNELCPPNKWYDLMDANKNIDLEHVQCPPKSKILTNIIKDHPLQFSIAASSSVPWIYMAQFWHTLKEDCLKYRLKFMLDRRELSLTLDDFWTIFHLPQATDNNHDHFVPPPSFYDMIPFYKNHLGFIMELKTPSSFKTTELLWEGIYYSLLHSTSSIPYLRFTKIIIAHFMTNFLEISRRKYKDKVGMKIPDWMITKAMKTPSAPMSPTSKVDASAPTRSTVIRLCLPHTKIYTSYTTSSHGEGQEHVFDNDEHNIPDTRLEPRSDKESLKVGTTDVIVPVNVYDKEEDEDKITDE